MIWLAKKVKITENELEAQAFRKKILQENCEILIISNYLGASDDSDAVEYFNILQKRALHRMRNSQIYGNEEECNNEGDIDEHKA